MITLLPVPDSRQAGPITYGVPNRLRRGGPTEHMDHVSHVTLGRELCLSGEACEPGTSALGTASGYDNTLNFMKLVGNRRSWARIFIFPRSTVQRVHHTSQAALNFVLFPRASAIQRYRISSHRRTPDADFMGVGGSPPDALRSTKKTRVARFLPYFGSTAYVAACRAHLRPSLPYDAVQHVASLPATEYMIKGIVGFGPM